MFSYTLQRVFFWTLVLLFFVTTGVLIFYALGYRFSFERGIFIHAGSISVKPNPQQVNITINSSPVSRKKLNYLNNSYHIDGLKPGEYQLKISSPGFQAWSKKVAVHSGTSTEFWNVLLAKEQYPRTSFYTSQAGKFFLSLKSKYIAYIQNQGQEFLVNILSLDSALSETVFSSPDYELDEKESIQWSPQEHAIIIPTNQKNPEERKKHYFIVDIDTKRAINLKDLAAAENIESVHWNTTKKNFVYYLTERNLYRLDLGSPQEKKLVAQNISGFNLSSSGLYYFQLPSGIVYRADPEGERPPVQITTSPPADMSNTNYQIVVYDEKRIALLNETSRKIFIWNQGDHDNYFRELSENASGAQFSDDGKKLLFWNDWEIFVYFSRDWEVQPVRLENELMNITRFSQKIENVQWSKDYEHVVFTTDKKIKVVELDHRDRRNIFDITALKIDYSWLISDFSNNKLYFTDKASEEDPFFEIYSIDFPEKTGILGL
ncbi:MAG: PEGA domain-containing protein [Candidatus Moranbacteria bacterium]|nr:PEGA domain-containing protein [Candidatus Moranbacteria bacterium]